MSTAAAVEEGFVFANQRVLSKSRTHTHRALEIHVLHLPHIFFLKEEEVERASLENDWR